MQDSRLIHALMDLSDFTKRIEEILEESPKNPAEVIHLASAVKFVRAATREVRAVSE